jgi:hypothetical protein
MRFRELLSKRQQTSAALFPQRAKLVRTARVYQQLELAQRVGFTCVRCDEPTSANGGDGMCCYRCQVRP